MSARLRILTRISMGLLKSTGLALLIVLALSLSGSQVVYADAYGFSITGAQSIYATDTLPNIEYSKGDHIQVIVNEQGTAKNDTNTNLRRKFDASAEVTEFAKLQGLSLVPSDAAGLPSVDITSEKRQEGRGSTTKNDSITTVIPCVVIDILPNGVLVLEGKTTRKISDEDTIVKLFGHVHPEHVTVDKKVSSNWIVGLDLEYTGNGPLSRNQGRTIISFLLEYVWPF